MATDIRTPYPYVFSMAYYTLTRILYYLNEVNIQPFMASNMVSIHIL